MTDIWLVRHGEAAAGFDQDTDPALSALGREQAAQSAEHLLRHVPDRAALLSSPKLRAMQTGEPFARARARALEVDKRFVELPSPDVLATRKVWIQEVVQGHWSELPESVRLWLEEIDVALLSCTSPTVIFTHFLVINAVAARMSGEDTVLQCLPANGSVHHLRVEGQAWRWISRGDMLESVVN